MNKPFFTVKTLAEKLAVKPMTIYRMVEQGKIAAYRVGKSIRFSPEDVEAFLASVRVGPSGLGEDKQEGPKS